MSSAVVPFAQQGSMDWVALSNASAHFSIGVLARLSKAGIDPFTLQMSRAICTDFTLTASVQQSLTDAIHKLKKYGSYGNVVWFGFGVKHIVTDLAETEEGLACVSLCAALSTIYDNMYSAQVLRDLCRLLKAPELFTPALQQWRTLVTLSSGILMSHRFSLHLNTFRTLISRQFHYPILSCQKATASSNLARAILTMAHISKGKLVNATFTGGLDCAWLAAFAEVVLSLHIEILGSGDMDVRLYRSQSDRVTMPQVRFLICDTTTPEQPSKDLSLSKTCLIESGRTLINFMTSDSRALRWRAPWASILRESFHGAVDRLLDGITGMKFMTVLYCLSNLPDLKRSYDKPGCAFPQAWCNLRYAAFPTRCEDDRIGNQKFPQKFLQLAVQKLPELASCIQGEFSSSLLPHTPDAMKHEVMLALRHIGDACACKGLGREKGCLITLSYTILVYLWILLSSTIEENVHPSVPGLIFLYGCQSLSCHAPNLGSPFINDNSKSKPEGLDLVLKVFSGISTGDSNLPASFCAASSDGICVYQNVIENPEDSPTSIVNYRVARGYISYAGTLFTGIQHRKNLNELDPSFDSLSIVRGFSSNMTVEAAVEETDNERILKMGFRVTYFDKTTRHTRCLWLDFSSFNLDRSEREQSLTKCNGNCRDLEGFELKWLTVRGEAKLQETVRFDPGCFDPAQEVLHRIRGSFETWMLMVLEDGNGRMIQLYVIDHYLLLYLIISNIRRILSGTKFFLLRPFHPCLSCLVRIGWRNYMYSYDPARMSSVSRVKDMSGTIELIEATEGKTNDAVEIIWNSHVRARGQEAERPGDQP